MVSNPSPSLKERALSSPFFRYFLVFSVFRAFYGAGILAVTWILATSEEIPMWTSFAFLLASMIFSRILFRRIKRRWPSIFEASQDPVV